MQTAKASSCNHIKRRWVTANHKALMTDSTCEKFLLRFYSANEEPGKCKGLLWQEWRGDLYYNQDQSCGNESRGYLDLTDQPASKITSFLWHNESYTPRLGEKAQLCQIWQSFWKEMLKPCIEKQRLWLIRIKEQCGNCRCMQQFRIDSLSVYEFEWNWPNLKGIMWIYITKYIN